LRKSQALFSLSTLVFLLFPAFFLAEPPTASTTTLALLPGSSVNSGTSITLTATVNNASSQPVLSGGVLFCNASAASCTGPAVLASAQLIGSGPAQGTASAKLRLGLGAHSIKAVFTGTNLYPSSASAAQSVTVKGDSNNATSISLAATGTTGDYTLTATEGVSGWPEPTGEVSFSDTTHGNLLLGQAALAGPPVFGFSSPISFTTNNSSQQYVAVGDFNGDGIPDLAMTSYYSGVVTILLGNGDGTFQLGQSYTVGGYPYSIAVADLNGDGKQDLAVVNLVAGTQGGFSVLLGNGDGTFQPQTQYFTGAYTSPSQVVVGDFNGDGIPDLALQVSGGVLNSSQSSTFLAVFLGNGDGTFQFPANYYFPTNDVDPEYGGVGSGGGTTTLAAGDFNNDGNLDLLELYENVNYGELGQISINYTGLSIRLGNGNGTFQAPTFLQLPSGFNASGATVGDFNGDGKLDVAVISNDGTQLLVLLGNGNGSFQTPVSYNTNINCDYCELTTAASVTQGDFNGQGRTDLAMSFGWVGFVQVMLGNGDGSFQPAVAYGVWSIESQLVLADLNGDGLPDIPVPLSNWVFLGQRYWTATLNGVSLEGANTLGSAPPLYCCLADASYGGDVNYAASASNTVPLVSNATIIPTTNTLTVSPAVFAAPGQTVTLTATIAPSTQGSLTAGGQVTFFDGSTQIGTAVTLASGKASTSSTTLALGMHSLTAVYSGDANFAGSASTAVTLTVIQPGFSLSLNPTAVTIRQGQTAQSQLTVTPVGGFSGTVTFSCSNLPNYSLCSFTPATVTADGSDSALTAEVSISTFGPNKTVAAGPVSGANSGTGLFALAGLPLGLLAFFCGVRRRRSRWLMMFAVLSLPVFIGVLNGCGATDCCTMPATPAGGYAVNITATSSSPAISQSAVLNLTITQ